MSKEARHTPGPWYTRHGQISSETSPHGCTIANCNATAKGISDEEVEANARLIAAAPELLQACCELVSAYDRLMETNGSKHYMDASHTFTAANWLNGNGNNAAIQVARAAIAKVEGR